MKKLLLPLFLFLFLIPNQSRSSHIIGGEVYWECLGNGRFVFKMNIYRDCSGIQFNYSSQTLDIIGNPLPRNSVNGFITSIVMMPDSNKYLAKNFGQISPNCTSSGTPYSCANGDPGALQEFPFISSPIQLRGTPPANGWRFVYTAPCCRPATENLSSLSGSFIISSVMYGDGTAVDTCYDSSPIFAQSPDYIFCRGQWSNGMFTSYDEDGDKLVYRFDSTFNTPILTPRSVPYAFGYAFDNPTPDTSFQSNNQALNLNTTNGWFDFQVNSNGGIKKYWLSAQIDAYRNGVRLSSTHRELPIMITDCPNLSTSQPNMAPQVLLPFGSGNIPDTSIMAGTYLDFPIMIQENQQHNNMAQQVTTRVYGSSLSRNLSDSTFCNVIGDTLCATYTNVFSFNSSQLVYERFTLGSDTLGFRWQTDCQDLDANNGPKTHYFTVRVKDDFCPVPAISYQVFSVTVLPNPPLCGAVTGVSELKQSPELSIYPNPSEGRVNIERSESTSLMIQIFDLRGQLVKEDVLFPEQNSLLLPENSGVYILRITDGSGAVNHHKVIKN